MKRSAILTMALAVTAAWAGEDIAGAKDHPLLTRYPDSLITEYTKNYNATEFQVGARGTPPKVQTVEGDTTTARYFYESPEKQPSPLQLLRNYQNAVKHIGGAVVYERLPKDLDAGETTLQVTTGGKDVWVKVLPDIFSAPTQSYQLVITEVAAMAQVDQRQRAVGGAEQERLHRAVHQLRHRQGGPEAGRRRDGQRDRDAAEGEPDVEARRRRPHRQRR